LKYGHEHRVLFTQQMSTALTTAMHWTAEMQSLSTATSHR